MEKKKKGDRKEDEERKSGRCEIVRKMQKTEDYRRTVEAEVADRQPYIYLSNDYNRTQS